MIRSRFFGHLLLSVLVSLSAGLVSASDKVPKVLSDYLQLNEVYEGDVFEVQPPKELEKFIAKVRQAAAKDPDWFNEYSAQYPPGVPMPYHEKLGLSKEEYKEYRATWDKRKFKVLQKVGIRLEKSGDQYLIRVTGKGSRISLLRFDPESGKFRSPNGDMERLEDIDAPADSILRAWKGHEWRFQEKTGLGLTKENFALGKNAEGTHGMIIYRLQDFSSTGTPLFDNSVAIRFALKKKAQ